MSERTATHIRLRWMTPEGVTEPITVSVRAVRERTAFAMLATSHGPGTRGRYELLADGEMIREGSCRIIFQKKGAGIGIELLERPPMRRSSVPVMAATQPSQEHPSEPPPRAPSPVPSEDREQDDAPEGILGSERPARARKATTKRIRTQVGIGLPSDSVPRAPTPEPEPEEEEGKRHIGATGAPPADTKRSSSKTQIGIGIPRPDAPKPEVPKVLSDVPTAHEVSDAADVEDDSEPLFFEDARAYDGFEENDELTFEEDEPSIELTRAPSGSVPDLEIFMEDEETGSFARLPLGDDDAQGDAVEDRGHAMELGFEDDGEEQHDEQDDVPVVPGLDLPELADVGPEWAGEGFELPELPKWEPPPPSPPPPRYEATSWEPPDYEPALASAEPPARTSDDGGPRRSMDPGDEARSSRPIRRDSIAAPKNESSHAPSHPPPRETPSSAAKHSARTARVATRVAGHGAEGVAIGIDLGTSNTCASAVINGVPQVIPTRFGTSTVPSVLTVIDSRVVVGHAAQKRMIMNPHETVYGSKRLVGRAYTEQLADEYQPSFAYPLVETEDHRFGASLKGRVISFEQVAEYLLAEVRDVAERHLDQKVYRATITVPAYFGEAQREAVRRAARGAQLHVDRIVPEPTAAAVAYGYNAKTEHTLVVFDLGGGTFDVSVLRVGNNRFEVLATGGDAFLGGIDVDDLLANYLLEEFQRNERTTLEPSPQQIARLREAAEEAKRGLSMQKRVAVNLPHFARIGETPVELRATIDRETLDGMASGFVDRLIAITASTLADCRVSPMDVDDILMVGGMTRMTLVPERVEEYFGKRPSKRINPDEAVALGAARLAADGTDVELLDVLPLSIGVAGEGRRFQRLIARNTQVPSERAFIVRTRADNQSTYRMPLFQGERVDAAENEYLGTVVIDEIPQGPKGTELELLFSLDEQCFLEVRAAHVASGNGLAVFVDREEGADKAIAKLESFDGPDEGKKPKKKSGLGRFFQKLRSIFGG